MQHLFRLSQKRKEITHEGEYGRHLGGALEVLANGRTLRRMSILSLQEPNQSAAAERKIDALRVLAETWEILNVRRLGLEELRPDDRISRVHEEAVKSLRAALESWNREGHQLVLILQGKPAQAARQQQDVDNWRDMLRHVEGKLRAELQLARQQHPEVFGRLQLPADILDSYDVTPLSQPEGVANSFLGTKAIDLADMDWPRVEISELATYLRLHLEGEGDRSSFPREAELHSRLEAVISQPDTWNDLADERLILLVAWAALHIAYTGNRSEIAPLAHLYQIFAQRVAPLDRHQLVVNVSMPLESNIVHLQALMPFIFNDPDQFVVSTAALNFSTICPLSNDDPLTGPKRCLAIVAEYGDGSDMMTLGVLTGLLALGDRRLLPLVDGIWNSLSRDIQRELTTTPFDWLYASTMEFWLRWLEDVDEDAYGFPAQALMRAALREEDDRVLDVHRRFPAPFTLSEEDIQRDAPIQYLHDWSIRDFGRIIEPRLRRLYLRETYSPVLPAVMAAWGIDPGELDEREQAERIVLKFEADAAALQQQANEARGGSSASTVEGRALSGIAKTFGMTQPPHALASMRGLAEKLDPEEAASVLHFLEHRFGPDLEAAQQDMAFGWLHARPNEVRAMGVDPSNLQ